VGLSGLEAVSGQISRPSRPVYVDDSPGAAEAIDRAQDLASIGNLSEAARVLQTLLDTEGDRVVATADDPDLFVPVRSRVHQLILDSPELLDRYRTVTSRISQQLLEHGDIESLVESYFLTAAGFEAALRRAQVQLEGAQFEAAWRMLLDLEDHPDRQGPRAQEALELLTVVAGYVGMQSPEQERDALQQHVAKDLARWRGQAGLAPQPITPPEAPLIEIGVDPLDPGQNIDVAQLLERPLWRDGLGARGYETSSGNDQELPGVPSMLRELFSMPVVVGDTVYLNNGMTTSAWNRFTLGLKWREEEQGAMGSLTTFQRPSRWPEEPATIAVRNGVAVSITGLRVPTRQSSLNRWIVARDAQTGKTLWRADLALLGLPEAGNSVIAGPLVIDQGVVIATIEKSVLARRLDSTSLMGLGLRDGQLKWIRPLGSSGSLNYQQPALIGDAASVFGGVIYVSNSIGLNAAVETATGRPLWIRRNQQAIGPSRRDVSPWQISRPVMHDNQMIVLSPNRSQILVLDAETGALRLQVSAGQFGNPEYLLEADGMLVGVTARALYAAAIADLSAEVSVRSVGILDGDVIRGRAVAAGQFVIVPTARGVKVFDVHGVDTQPVSETALDNPGAILPLESELIVVDNRSIYTYLVWEVAERMLRERMESATWDPEPAITYAELSYRAGRMDGVLPTIDLALKAAERDPLSERSERALERLFDAVMEMLEPTGTSAGVGALPIELRGELVTRLGRCAASTSQRVAYLLTAGTYYESADRADLAVENFQNILDNDELASARFARGSSSVGARFEATRRLRDVLQRHGRALYAPYEAEADAALEALTEELDTAPFEALALRYPLAPAAAMSLAEASKRYDSQGRTRQASLTLERALMLARDAVDADDPLLGELGGRLVMHLVHSRQLYLAKETMDRLKRDAPQVALTNDGLPLDLAALEQSIAQNLSGGRRRPRLGALPGRADDILGWAIALPWAQEIEQSVNDRIMMRSKDGELALWSIDEEDGKLKKTWSAQNDEFYLWMDDAGVVTAREVGNRPREDYLFLRRDLRSGVIMWQTEPFRSYFAPGELDRLLQNGGGIVPSIKVPVENELVPKEEKLTQITIEFDQQTIVAMDRTGRAASFNARTGRMLWSHKHIVPRLYDMKIQGGTLLVGGSEQSINFDNLARGFPEDEAPDSRSLVVALDARTGEVIRSSRMNGRVRWVRITPEGLGIVGLDGGIASLPLFGAETGWSNDSDMLRMTTAAWVLPGRIIVRQNQDNRLWQIRSEDGGKLTPLNSQARLRPQYRELHIHDVDGQAVMVTAHGMVMFDQAGALAGLDRREGMAPILFGGFGEMYVPTLSSSPEQDDGDLLVYDLNMYTVKSLRAISLTRVELGTQPQAMALLDNMIILSAGTVTRVLSVPSDDEQAHIGAVDKDSKPEYLP